MNMQAKIRPDATEYAHESITGVGAGDGEIYLRNLSVLAPYRS